MAARRQLPNCRVEVKSVTTDSKAGNETHVGLDMRTTEDDWDRLGKLVKTGGVTISVVTFAPSDAVEQHKLIFGEDDRRRHEKVKNATKEVQRVLFMAGKDENPMAIGFLRDIGMIKCLSVMYDIPNPFLYIPALDGFECPFDETFGSGSEKPVKRKGKEITALEINVFNISTMHLGACSRAKFKATEKRLITSVKQLTARQDADARMKAKAAEKLRSREKAKSTEKSEPKLKSKAAEISDSICSNNDETTEEYDNRKRAKATEYSDAKMESKATDGSEPKKIAKEKAEKSNSRKRDKAREKSSTKQELKATEKEVRSMNEVMMDESEEGKTTDDQKKASSIKSVRTCMNCGLQEPAPKVFKKCRRCKDEGCPDPPYYCGRDCQVLDWTARHRQEHEKNYAEDPASS